MIPVEFQLVGQFYLLEWSEEHEGTHFIMGRTRSAERSDLVRICRLKVDAVVANVVPEG